MEPGPLPPHERSWRHPSELGPTRVDVDDSSPRHHVAALVTGGLMVVALAVMVVAVTPRSNSGPVAISVTTSPIGPRVAVEAEPNPPVQRVAVVSASTRVFVNSFSASPHAISSSPELTLDGADVAVEEPAGDDVVRVRTDAVTYELPWAMATMLDLPDGSVVFDTEGRIVAHVSRGDFLHLVVD